MHLYDAWAPMRADHLLESEKKAAGHYSNITIQRVKKTYRTSVMPCTIPDIFRNHSISNLLLPKKYRIFILI